MASILRHIPSISLLCMESEYIPAFNAALAKHWPSFTQTDSKPAITVLNSSLSDVPSSHKFDLVVSPANSYGRLDGAFDDAISTSFCLPHNDYFTLTRAAQKVLYERWRGFAPPGSCTLVPFPKELCEGPGANAWGCKWVAICPTMRRPQAVSWDREVVYECVWSLLCQIEGWNRQHDAEAPDGDERIKNILITPLATGVGGVSRERWAAQFVLALKHFVDALERPERWSELSWKELVQDAWEVEKTWNR